MRPLRRYQMQLKREAGQLTPVTETGDPRLGPPCLRLEADFLMPDGSVKTISGLWPSNDHLPLEAVVTEMTMRATAEAAAIKRTMP